MQFRRDLGKAQEHFFSLWKCLRQDGLLPKRQAIGIRELRQYVTHYVLVDLNENGHACILHSGTGFDDLWGRNISGCLISDLVSGKTLELLLWFFKAMIEKPCGGHSEEIFTKKTGDIYQLNILYLPVLKADGGVIVAAVADVKILGPTDYIHVSNRSKEVGPVIEYADFLDIGYGSPSGYYNG